MTGWTYGAEHEWGDWPMLRQLPAGHKRDERDVTVVSSNGIANDPSGRDYAFGGEINTPPTDTPEGQVEILSALLERYPEAVVNYRSNLHLHVRVPGLRDDLPALKRVQAHVHHWMPRLLRVLEPELFVRPEKLQHETTEEHEGHLRRWRRRRVSHGTLLTEGRVQRQLAARTVEEFFEAEVPRSAKGQVMWHAQPRVCVNLRQLRETDTIEFRCFPGTLDQARLRHCLGFVRDYTRRALGDNSAQDLLEDMAGLVQPFPRYVHWQELRYRATACDGTVPREERRANIAAILEGRFDHRSDVR